ncbi:Mannose-1-phosphate guanylyltransferase [Halomicronema hongdechloris C2206]|uniref:mannose-1-phosphate guanylyltransferase n=1 Tax=Halomicronema hongdechloris C2206 TaxID=1641165 RepID=A0A1V8NDM3_9CYAN|nr:mannose-1-phosphate guanylyltransferase [Halomicronema hongdechloris]ASC72999.1 Mannose-1-phosphate guanylyltransferase [Halomicronema hongdechloris C2206]
MATTLIPVILAGGKGERFWPVSRRQRPKQFLSLDGSGVSLLQGTAQRLLMLTGDWRQLWVITAAHLADGVRQQLPQLPESNLLVEPEGRDTAPAVAWATLEIAKRHGPTAMVGFFPADHWIDDDQRFCQTVTAAAALATEQDAIATLGIRPTYAATGYGYIEQGDAAGSYGSLEAYRVSRFTEKPDQATAADFIASGRFSWNSGMFIFPAQVMLQELKTHAPQLIQPLTDKGAAAYGELTKLSIDYAVMEKTERAYVMPVSFGWDDLGDWNAVERLLKQPDQVNVELATHVGLDTQGSILYSSDPSEVVVTIGLDDVVVVRDGNATLIVRKDRTQDIKKAVKQLGADDRFHHLL